MNSWEVVLSRLAFVYLSNLLVSTIVALPAVIIYGINAETGISGSIIFLLSLVFLPVIPMIISLGLGVMIAAVSSRSRHKNILSLVLSTLVVLLIVAVSTQAQNRKPDEILDIGRILSNMANRIYPPVALISKAVEGQNFLYFFLFERTKKYEVYSCNI